MLVQSGATRIEFRDRLDRIDVLNGVSRGKQMLFYLKDRIDCNKPDSKLSSNRSVLYIGSIESTGRNIWG